MEAPGQAEAKSADKATIILQVDRYIYDGTGYQILFDSDKDTYGSLYPGNGTLASDIDYSEHFEVSLPSGARPTGPWVGMDEIGTIELEPGVYDYCVVHPTATGTIYVSNGGEGDATGDNVEFKSGITYKFTVDQNDYGDYVVLEIVNPYDLALTQITAPFPIGTDRGEEEITVGYQNRGAGDITNFKLSYQLNDGAWVTENVTVDALSYGETGTYTFSAKGDFSTEETHLTIAVSLENDGEAANDTLRTVIYNTKPLELPFVCNFVEKTDLERWFSYGPSRWGCGAYGSADEESNNCAYITTMTLTAPQYLITRQSLHMEEGSHHFSFYNKGYYGGSIEHFTVMYGTSANPENMQVLRDYPDVDNTDTEWNKNEFNFDIEAEGNYYFAIKAQNGTQAYVILLDDVTIEKGKVYGVPDMQTNYILPLSSCDLTETEKLVANVSNIGLGDISKIHAVYKVNGETQEADINVDLRIGESMDIAIADISLSLSEENEIELALRIVPQAEEEKTETDTTNNDIRSTVVAWTPMNLPMKADFRYRTGLENLIWVNGAWGINEAMDGNAYTAFSKQPMYTRCMNLKKDVTYRVEIDYKNGYWDFYNGAIVDTFKIVYGKLGTDIDTWTTLESGQTYTEDLFVQRNLELVPKEDGIYNMALVTTSNYKAFCIREFSISEVLDYDVRMHAFGLPKQMPFDQMNAAYKIPVTVMNAGKQVISEVKVSVQADGTEAGEKTFPLGYAGAAASSDVELTVNGKKPSDKVVFEAVASITEHEADDTNPDNTLQRTVLVTDDVLAYDNLGENLTLNRYVVRVDGTTPLTYAVPMYFPVRDTLTGISIMLEESVSYTAKIAICQWNETSGEMGPVLYTDMVRVDGEKGTKRFEISSMLLDPGHYLLVFDIYAMICDGSENMFYNLKDGELAPLTAYGYPVWRAIFGHDGEAFAKDAAVLAITQPEEKGYFSASEKIVATVANRGHQEVVVPVKASVNGIELESQTVTLPAYGQKEVTFTADLSAPSTTYKIVVMAALEGDENPANDTFSKEVISFEPADPYVMDFEYCRDFAIADFTPAWQSVDKDGANTYDWAEVSFPGSGSDFGFMAFNPSATTPAIDNQMTVHGGKRVGVSFPSIGTDNNDWLISPKLKMAEDKAGMEMWVSGFGSNAASFNVLVSSSDNIDDFEVVYSKENVEVGWSQITVDLSRYNGKEVYVAIQCTTKEQAVFMVDDIVVKKPAASNSVSELASQLSLYPNPARQTVVINSNSVQIEQISIFNVSGMQVYSSTSLQTHQFRYNVSKLNAGMYFARVKTDQGTAVLKFMVE
ncbi:MAG: choice-of-anchor J domain-containing protein [Bacteroides sp.]|nr:choice-of-anchor J domain-containing protein [Bacteroides sp.]MCM1084720.1 choice-of-anchor J domain-containing protein [Bacteroides sp.]